MCHHFKKQGEGTRSHCKCQQFCSWVMSKRTGNEDSRKYSCTHVNDAASLTTAQRWYQPNILWFLKGPQ